MEISGYKHSFNLNSKFDVLDLGSIIYDGIPLCFNYNHIIYSEDIIRYFNEIFNSIFSIESEKYIFFSNGETIEWDTFEPLFKIILDTANKNNCMDRFFLIDSNCSLTLKHKNWNYLGIPVGLLKERLSLCDDFTPIKKRNIEKHFLSLNKREDKHRTDLISFIKHSKKELYLKTIYSYSDLEDDNPLKKILDYDYKNELHSKYDLDIKEWHYNSFCNIITESKYDFREQTPFVKDNFEFETSPIHFTEKLAKSVHAEQPFIILGSPNYLKKLKELGFKTFSNWWDESYDLILNYEDRFEKISELILDISEWSLPKCKDVLLEMEETLIYNKNLVKRLMKDYQYLNLMKTYKLNNTKKVL